MPAHAAWKGYLRVSLVSIPAAAYTAASRNAPRGIELNQLHEACHSRIRYQKVCPIHGEVASDEIVSGYEYAEGQYAVIDKAEIAELRVEGDKSIAVDSFVPAGSVDPVFLAGQTYYLTPDGRIGEKPYALLRDSLDEENLHGIGQVVISSRERLVRIRAAGKLLAMDVLHYEAEVKPRTAFEDEAPSSDGTPQEKKLTKSLLAAMTTEAFDPSGYKDEYVERVTEMIQAKVKGKELVSSPAEEEPQVINLIDALRESVKRIERPGKKATVKATPARKAASAKRPPAKPARKVAQSAKSRGTRKKTAKKKSG